MTSDDSRTRDPRAKGRGVRIDLDCLQEVVVARNGKQLIIRTPTTGVAGKLSQAVAIGLAPHLGEIAARNWPPPPNRSGNNRNAARGPLKSNSCANPRFNLGLSHPNIPPAVLDVASVKPADIKKT